MAEHAPVSKPRLATMAWRNLWRNRRRTILTLSSIVFGVFLAVLFTALQDRNWEDMIQLAARMGGGHVTLQHADYVDNPMLTKTATGTAELRQRAMADKDVVRAVERISGFGMLNTARQSYGAGFIAFDPTVEDEETLSILEGIVEGQPFATGRDGGIILGARLAKNLGVEMGDRVVYTMTDKHGEIVSGLARVSGLMRTGSPSIDNGLCLLPIDSVREVLGYGPDEAVQVAAFVSDQRRSDAVAARLGAGLPDEMDALPWHSANPELAGFIAMKVGASRFMEIIIALLVAAGIFNTLFVSVMERMREFGIMVALGFSPGQLFRLVMIESLWMGLVGLVLAAVVTVGPYLYLSNTGIDITSLIAESESIEIAGVAMPTVMKVGIYPINAVIIAIATLIAVLLSGIYPAWRAGRADPVETIRLV